MKKLYNIFAIILFLIVGTQSLFAQNKKYPLVLNVEINAVDVYPVGGDAPQGEYFDEFFNIADHWNISFPKITISKYMSDNMSISLAGSFNKVKKWGEFPGEPSVKVGNLTYIGVDGMFNYYFSGFSSYSKLKPFIGVGAGYTWLQQGRFNTFSSGTNKDELVGAGTVNGALGANYWINNRIGLNFQTTYKHSFKEYLTKHWQHSFGVIIDISKTKSPKKKEEVNDRDGDGVPDETDLCPDDAGLEALKGCPDSDGDGVADKDDLCPDIFGLKEFDGCKDSDGDGYADNIDDCPDVKGTLKGCPEVEEIVEVEPVYCFEDMEDIKAYFASLIRDGRIEVDGLKFKVQIGAFRNPPKPTYFDFLKDVGTADVLIEDELTKYRLGDYATLVETEAIRLNVIEQGVDDAFVVAFYDNMRISMREAIEILCSKK